MGFRSSPNARAGGMRAGHDEAVDAVYVPGEVYPVRGRVPAFVVWRCLFPAGQASGAGAPGGPAGSDHLPPEFGWTCQPPILGGDEEGGGAVRTARSGSGVRGGGKGCVITRMSSGVLLSPPGLGGPRMTGGRSRGRWGAAQARSRPGCAACWDNRTSVLTCQEGDKVAVRLGCGRSRGSGRDTRLLEPAPDPNRHHRLLAECLLGSGAVPQGRRPARLQNVVVDPAGRPIG